MGGWIPCQWWWHVVDAIYVLYVPLRFSAAYFGVFLFVRHQGVYESSGSGRW